MNWLPVMVCFSLFIQEHKQEIARLQDTIRRQEEELCNLRAERKLYVRPELENSLDRVERTIVNEINEECRRNSGILGNNPRKVNLKKYGTHKKIGIATNSNFINNNHVIWSCNMVSEIKITKAISL